MPTMQDLQNNGGAPLGGNLGMPTPSITMDTLRAGGGKTIAEIQTGSDTPAVKPSPASQENSSGGFNPMADLDGAENQKPTGFVSDVFQNTVGSKGLAGSAQLPGKTMAALSEYGPGGAHQAENLHNAASDQLAQASDLLVKARNEPDPAKKQKMRDIAYALIKTGQGSIKAANDIQDQTDTTPGEALGTTVNSALTAATVGTDSILGEAGLNIAKPLVEGTSDVLKSTKYLRAGANVAENVAVGAGYKVASNLQDNKPLAEGTGEAALWGGLIPVATKGAVGLKDAIQAGAELSSEGIINRIIKPGLKDIAYGGENQRFFKEPARGILNEGITANSLSDLRQKVRDRIHDLSLSIGSVGREVQAKLGQSLDLTPALQPLDTAMGKAAKNNNPALLNSLNNIKIALTHDLSLVMDKEGTPGIKIGGAKNLTEVGYENAVALMRDIGEHTKWTGNMSDDRILNRASQDAQRTLRSIMNNAADRADLKLGTQIRNLNQRFSDLVAASGAISRREIVAQRNNVFNIAQKIGIGAGVIGSLVTGVMSGDWAKAGMVLAGEAGLLGLSKGAESVAVQTRVAKFIDMLSPTAKRGILNSTPVLNNLYTRFTGKQQPLTTEKTLPLKAVTSVADKIGINPKNVDKIKTFLGLGKRAAEKAGMGEDYKKVLEHVSKKNIDPDLGF